jgi:hypothetical protein
MLLTCHTYIPEGGKMHTTYYAGFVRECLNELADIDQQIELLDATRDKERIAYLREESLKVQLRIHVFSQRAETLQDL